MHVIWHTVITDKFPHQFEKKDTHLHMEGFSMMLLDFKYPLLENTAMKIRLNWGSCSSCIKYFRGAMILF